MNLFRSEEHARQWEGFTPEMEVALLPVAGWAEIFSNPFFKERGRNDYISWCRTEAGAEAYGNLKEAMPRWPTQS